MAQPAASLQHFWHSADLAQEVAQAASFLPHVEQQPVVRKIAAAQTAASVSMVFIFLFFVVGLISPATCVVAGKLGFLDSGNVTRFNLVSTRRVFFHVGADVRRL